MLLLAGLHLRRIFLIVEQLLLQIFHSINKLLLCHILLKNEKELRLISDGHRITHREKFVFNQHVLHVDAARRGFVREKDHVFGQIEVLCGPWR